MIPYFYFIGSVHVNIAFSMHAKVSLNKIAVISGINCNFEVQYEGCSNKYLDLCSRQLQERGRSAGCGSMMLACHMVEHHFST